MCVSPEQMLSAGSTVFSAATTLVSGFSAAQVSRYNARQTEKATYQNEAMQVTQTRQQIADQTVALANSGGNADTGTPLLLLGESARNARLNQLATRQVGLDKANAYRMQAQGQIQNAVFGAGAQLLGGATQPKLQQLGAIGGSGGAGPPSYAGPDSFGNVG